MPPGISFFATPDEQRDWVLGVIKEHGLWCALLRREKSDCRRVGEQEVARLQWTGRYRGEFSLFLGDPAVAPPFIDPRQWPATHGMVMARSQAVELMSALLTSEKHLMQGDLRMLSKALYSSYEVDGTPTESLYKKLKTSLSRLWDKDRVVIFKAGNGSIVRTGIHITPGAPDLYRQGWQLHEGWNARITYEVWDREAVMNSGFRD